ncbi:MAG: pilus assembly protein TadG-related protein [Candidatus Dormibacteria bacterium]
MSAGCATAGACRQRGIGRTSERGQTLVLACFLGAALLGAVGLAVDAGMGFARERMAQNAADAGALAAAYDIGVGDSETVATTDAQSVVKLGGEPASSLTLTFLDSYGNATASGSQVATVTGSISETSPTTFMRALGINSSTVQNNARARVPRGAPCGLCVLSPSASPAVSATGNGNVTVTGNSIMVDSSAHPAATVTGNGSMSATSIGVVGSTSSTGNGSYSPAPVTGIPPFPDPLAGVPVPSVSGANQGSVNLSGNNSQTLDPGVYTTLSVSGNGTLTLNPGIYVVTGGVSATGNGNLVGHGVMIYFACASYPAQCNTGGQSGASLSLTGNGSYDVTAPSSGTYQGLGVFYDRHNTSSLSITGNGSDNLTGTIYGASASLTLTGNGDTSQFNSLVVVNTATFTGNGGINLAFNQSQNYNPPSLPSLIQ